MHEIGIVRSMCKTVLDYARENNIQQISEIVCQIGELSLVIPQYVEELYPVVAAGTALENTKLVMEMVPGLAECRECDEIFNVVQYEGYCPNCGSFEKDVLSGEDFNIKEIHNCIKISLFDTTFCVINNERVPSFSLCVISAYTKAITDFLGRVLKLVDVAHSPN